MAKHYDIRVHGRVQGVFFRASTQEKAKELGITDHVRNESNGTVYIEVEGPEDILEDFLSWCNEGPPAAIVEKVDYKEDELQNYKRFEVR